MKNRIKFLTLATLVALGLSFSSCNDDKGGDTPPPPPQQLDLGDGSTEYTLPENTTLKYPNVYTLKGTVVVPAGKTLTIEPGVIIKGEKASKAALLIDRGGKIMAQGTKERPIVFTSAQAPGSRKSGDWGGIIILGKAPNNKGNDMSIEGGITKNHGGSDAADNSGVLSYVRIEFAGIEYQVDNEINGLTMGSVGSGTKIDHVQVSYCGDDSFEWFGGTVNCSHLISLAAWDDDFDTDNGFCGKIQFGIALRNPKVADKSSSNGFESDNESKGATIDPRTRPIFANMSIFGPVTNPASYTDEGNVNGSTAGIFQSAVQIRRSSQMNLFNSVVAGFPIGLIIENDKAGSDSQESATNGIINVSNCVMAGMVKNFQDAAANKAPVDNGAASTFVKAYWEQATRDNSALATIADLKLQGNPQALTAPNMCPKADSPLATGAKWDHANVNVAFFTKTAYKGAFGPTETATNNWMTGWTNFDPQNTVY